MFTDFFKKYFQKSDPDRRIGEMLFPEIMLSATDRELYLREGYLVVKDYFTKDVIAEINDAITQLGILEFNSENEKFWTTGRIESAELRQKVSRRLDGIISPYHKEHLLGDKYDVYSGSVQVKPPSKESMLNPHQDSSLTDETTQVSFYLWFPLIDVDQSNGTLAVLPKSHLLGINCRSLNVKWPLRNIEKELWELMVPLNLNAGDLVIFDSATIHSSFANHSSSHRLAISCFAKPLGSALLHSYADESDPDNVEVYKIDLDFFLKHNFMERPKAPYTLLRKSHQPSAPWSISKVKKKLKAK